MSANKPYIAVELRARIAEQARQRCGYCLSPQELLGMPLEVEHTVPHTLGGPTVEENLWLACPRCNRFKRTQIRASDPQTNTVVSLFHPRQQTWTEHFTWSDNGTHVFGISPTGRAMVSALQLNNAEIVVTRRMWVSVGWWPPHDE